MWFRIKDCWFNTRGFDKFMIDERHKNEFVLCARFKGTDDWLNIKTAKTKQELEYLINEILEVHRDFRKGID